MTKLVVFDMAGTTVDEQNVVYKTLQKAINHGGIPVTLEQVLDLGAGKEKKTAIIDILARHAPGQSDETIESMFQYFLKELKAAYDDLDVIPIKGAEEVFAALKSNGIKVVLNTGYNGETANKLVNKLGWKKGEQYDELVTASDVAKARPEPDMILHAMKLTGISNAAEVVKIGDSAIDVIEGKNAGCGITVGITTGAQTKEQIAEANPNFIVDDLKELLAVIGIAG